MQNKTPRKYVRRTNNIEALAKKRKIQKEHYLQLIEREGDKPAFAPLRFILLNENISLEKAEMKYKKPRTTLQRWLDKLEHSSANPLTYNRKDNGKISQKLKGELRKILSEPPFKLPPTVIADSEGNLQEVYYAHYHWTNGFLAQYILELWGIELTPRRCTDYINELSPLHNTIFDILKSTDISNVWIFLNFKICEKEVTIVRGISDIVEYYACVAHLLGSGEMISTVYPRRSQYANFIKNICDVHISTDTIIFFAENNSKKKTKDNNFLAFREYHKKIKMIRYSAVKIDMLYNKTSTIKELGEGAERSYDADAASEWLKNKLLYNRENIEDADIMSDDAYELEDIFAVFCQEFLIGIRKIMIAIDKAETGLPEEDIQKEIKKQLDEIQISKE